MRTLFKGLSWVLLFLGLAIAGVFAFAWWKTEQALTRHYQVKDPPLMMVRDNATLERGKHLFDTLACEECHAAGGVGKLAIDAGPVGKVFAPNITPGGIGSRYDADRLAVAIRHGVRADGTPLRFMPSEDFTHLSDTDVAALVAYLQALPSSDHRPGETYFTPLGRVMAAFNAFELTPAASIDHSPRLRTAPAIAATAEYGAYLTSACSGCHGANFAGHHVPGTPPEFPDSANLTPDADGLKKWQFADFQRVIRTGKRPDGRELHPFMPWRAYSRMNDTELAAIWARLSSLPPVASKKKKA